MVKYLVIWACGLAVYGVFWFWHSGLQAPLLRDEITDQLAHYAHLYKDGTDADRRARLRGFLAADDGGEVFSVHLIRMRARPLPIDNMRAGYFSSFDVLGKYADMIRWPLFIRAGYPVLIMPAVSLNLEAWGAAARTEWTHMAIIRHRSRRDMMALIMDPDFAAHYKFARAAMEAHFTFSAAPAMQFLILRPHIIMAWIIFALAALTHMIAAAQDRRR